MNTVKNAQDKATTYFKGDKAKFNGTINILYGATFAEAKIVEGPRKGQIIDIKVS